MCSFLADDVAPLIDIVKDGEATINEGGDTATYSIKLTNNSVVTDPVTITSLDDDQFGNLLPEAEAANGGAAIVLASGASFSCPQCGDDFGMAVRRRYPERG